MIRKPKAKDSQSGSANKIAELQKANAQLQQLIKSHEKVIENTKKSLKEKEQDCEALTEKNHELTTENAELKKTIAILEKTSQDQKNTISNMRAINFGNAEEINNLQRRVQISYYNRNRR